MIDMKNPQYGGFWIRVVAAILDTIIIGIPIGIISNGLLFLTGVSTLYYLVQLAAVIIWIYLTGIKGGTPGKLILGYRVVNDKGEFIGIARALLRYIAMIISALPLFIGYFMIGFTQKKQGLHDMIAKTYVVKA